MPPRISSASFAESRCNGTILTSMATIGRYKAVASVAGMKFSGHLAWLAWVFVHLISYWFPKPRFCLLAVGLGTC